MHFYNLFFVMILKGIDTVNMSGKKIYSETSVKQLK